MSTIRKRITVALANVPWFRIIRQFIISWLVVAGWVLMWGCDPPWDQDRSATGQGCAVEGGTSTELPPE